jgi:glycosyltransferase involved in cell wall biosynthesis
MKVLISHPGKQHVYSLVKNLSALHEVFFITTLCYSPLSLEKLKKKFYFKIVESNVLKRFANFNAKVQVTQIKRFEILYQVIKVCTRNDWFSRRVLFWSWKFFDKKVAILLSGISPDIIIGYETSSLNTFKKAKELNTITVLDLAYVHYEYNLATRDRYVAFASTFKDQRFYKEENIIKAEELRYTDYILCLSSIAKQSLIEAGISQSKIFTYHLGIDTLKFLPKSEYRASGNPVRLLYVGGVTQRKGLNILLSVVKQMEASVELVIVGPIVEKNLLDLFLGLPNVLYKGFLHKEELIKTYQKADVFVFPSYLDSWGQVVLEAMACGLPVIVTDQTGAKDVIDETCGFVIPAGDEVALKNSIDFFIQDHDKLETMGTGARKIAEKYSLENYSFEINQIIKRISETNDITN